MAISNRVLFISAPVGAGHIKAAESIASAMHKQDQIETKMANVFDFFNPYIGQGILSIYLKILKIFPKLYGMMYGWGNESHLALLGRQLVSRYLAKNMERYILDFNPAAIVCTHATPAGLVAYLLKQNRINMPVVVVITDFVVHRLWIYPEIKHYIVANEDMRECLIKSNVESTCTKVMGIPVDEKFSCSLDKEKILNKFGFASDVKTVLIMGGGAGILPMDNILLACDAITIPLQIIVVTGNNKTMYKKICSLEPKLRNKVLILGYVNYVNELMAISDLIISKPGGMTCAETLCSGLPMLIYQPIPGQEEANTNYLIAHNVALRADSMQDIGVIMRRIFIDKPEELNELRQNALQIRNPQAGAMIGNYIFSQIKD